MIRIDTFEQLEEARRRSHAEPIVLYKHSATCGVSTMARREVVPLSVKDHVPVYEIVVQSARPISDEVERRYGIRHESPQVIVLHRDQPTYHTSHGRIREEVLREAVARPESARMLP
ncbi:MAG TPA: bacillithiol system redox-active protein YtxJ [Rhodothermales bacterium]